MLTIEVYIGVTDEVNREDYFLKAKELYELSKQDATIKVRPDRSHSYLRDKIMAKHIDKRGYIKKKDYNVIHHCEGKYKFDYIIKLNNQLLTH